MATMKAVRMHGYGGSEAMTYEDAPRPKPAPDMLRAGLEKLGVSAEESLYIGDMVVDIETARAAGVPVWVIPTGSDEQSTLHAAKPDRLLGSLRELSSLSASERFSP